MLEFLPRDVQDGLESARRRARRRRSRLHLQVGGAVFPVMRLWSDGFSLDAGLCPGQLRGLVDVYDGPRHVLQCLIVASALEEGELICAFKRATPVAERAALDYWRGEGAPGGYLPRA